MYMWTYISIYDVTIQRISLNRGQKLQQMVLFIDGDLFRNAVIVVVMGCNILSVFFRRKVKQSDIEVILKVLAVNVCCFKWWSREMTLFERMRPMLCSVYFYRDYCFDIITWSLSITRCNTLKVSIFVIWIFPNMCVMFCLRMIIVFNT